MPCVTDTKESEWEEETDREGGHRRPMRVGVKKSKAS